jgi:hypothetical protein
MQEFEDIFGQPGLYELQDIQMTKDEFITKTKQMLALILEEYSNSFADVEENESCTRCGGFCYIEEGGETIECYSCNSEGVEIGRVFDKDSFVEFMEHEVMFGGQPFLELLECKIISN